MDKAQRRKDGSLEREERIYRGLRNYSREQLDALAAELPAVYQQLKPEDPQKEYVEDYINVLLKTRNELEATPIENMELTKVEQWKSQIKILVEVLDTLEKEVNSMEWSEGGVSRCIDIVKTKLIEMYRKIL